MKRREFDAWLTRHRTLFPSVNSHLARLPVADAEVTLDAWARQMAFLTLDEANVASDAMLAGEVKRPFVEELVAAVCGYVRQLRGDRREREPRFVDGQRTVACLPCEDEGLVVVWNDRCIARAKSGETWKPIDGTGTAIACSCIEGDRKAKGIAPRDPRGVRRFQPGTDVLFVSSRGTRPMASDPADWRRFCEQVAAARPAGFHEEFAAFSQ